MVKQNMFLETDKQRALKIREYLDTLNLKYSEKSVHELIHFTIEQVTEEQCKKIKNYYQTLEAPVIEKRHRKWDEKYHTLSEEIKGEFTGANREEEVEDGN